MQKPSWCFVVNTMYFCPAWRARSTHACGSNRVGLNVAGSARYAASVIPPGLGTMMGQEASTLAWEYGPQWMNMPNLACRYQRVRSDSVVAIAEPRRMGKQLVATAAFRNVRRLNAWVIMNPARS